MLHSMNLDKVILDIVQKYNSLTEKLADHTISTDTMVLLSKEVSEIEEVASHGGEYLDVKKQISELRVMLNDESLDDEMKRMIDTELYDLESKIEGMEKTIKVLLLPRDTYDTKNAILEIRQGAGGNEAGLFASEILRMYQKFAERNRWKFEIIDYSTNDAHGVKEAVAIISGKNVFSNMKFESGAHRVQRVPDTETNGRVHTSTITVAVLPEMDEVDVKIDEKDLRIEIFRSSGPGGQSVNTTDSAVRVTHIPTGIIVSQQDERSQIKNREKAMKVLRSKLYEYKIQKQHETMTNERREQIGTGDRSEKIRTYNYPQNRITDHRINLTVHNINNVVGEGEIDEIIKALMNDDEARRLATLS